MFLNRFVSLVIVCVVQGLAMLALGCAPVSLPPSASHGPEAEAPFATMDVFANRAVPAEAAVSEEEGGAGPYLVVLVSPVGMDYSSAERFVKTLHKHPRGGKFSHAVGHSWIILSNGDDFYIECGHTGEYGFQESTYYRKVLLAAQRGEDNPARHLWDDMRDGRYEPHNGGNEPTLAVKFAISPEAFTRVKDYIEAYDFKIFSLTKTQCTTFAAGAAAQAGIHLGHTVTMRVPQTIIFEGATYTLWTDPQYASLAFSTPDILERSLALAVSQGLGEDVTELYLE